MGEFTRQIYGDPDGHTTAMQKFWIAHYDDFSEMAVFVSEIESRRYAMDNGMTVAQVEEGAAIREAVKRP